MTPKRNLVEDDELGLSVSSGQSHVESTGGSPLARFWLFRSLISRHRVILGGAGIAIVLVALVAWRWSGRGESKPATRQSANSLSRSRQDSPLQVTVLGVRDVAAAVPGAGAVEPLIVVPATVVRPTIDPAAVDRPATGPSTAALPAAAPAASAAVKSSTVSRPAPVRTTSTKTAPTKASAPRPAAVAAKPRPPDEPRVETPPAKPTATKPDNPPLETNPYVYK